MLGWPPMWFNSQSLWLQIQRSGFDSRHYQIFWEVVGLERGPLSLVSTTEKLLGRKSSGSSLENWEYCRGNPLRWPRDSLYFQKLALNLLTSGGRSVGTALTRTHATEWKFFGNVEPDVAMGTVESVIWIGLDCGNRRPRGLPNDNSVWDVTEQVFLAGKLPNLDLN
jgi:hypothetical protein